MQEEQTFPDSWATARADVIYLIEFDGLLTQIDAESLAREHLATCQYRLEGYWDDDEFYDQIILNPLLDVALESSALKAIANGYQTAYLINLNFILSQNDEAIGELSLIFNSKMEFIDENWSIDVDSSFVVAKRNA